MSPEGVAPVHEFRRTESLRGRASSRKVRLLVDSMSVEGWVGPPITAIKIGIDKYILDGHHRCYAARKLGISVYFRVVAPELLLQYGYRTEQEVVLANVEAGPNRIRLD